MADINYDPANYNNGVPPEPGVVWNGDTWGWPTRGYDIPPGPGETEPGMVVTPQKPDTWPKRPGVKEWYVPGEKPFDPITGDGWVPDEDGYSEALPAGVPAEVQNAVNQVKSSPRQGGMSSSDIWKLTPAPDYPGPKNTFEPVFVWFPAQALTDGNVSGGAPETVAVHTRVLDDVHDGAQYISAVSTGAPYDLPVVKATPTLNSAYYTIGHLAGFMAPFTFTFTTRGQREDSRFIRNEAKAGGGVREAGFTVGANTSDCIVWFPEGSGIEALYFSMVMNMPAGPLQRRQETENKARSEADAAREAEAKRKADEEAKKKEAEAAAEKEKDEKEALTKASELIADMGEKIGEHLGEKYKCVAKEIAEDIKNFQGRTLRNYEQTMASLKKILDNPNMKINKGDKDAIVNAWKSFKADDTAKKLSNLSKAFHAADVALKIEKVREKSIEGYETGNWGPLVLEVESWIISGVAVGVAIGILADIAPVIALTFSLPVSAVTIVGIIGIGFIASKLDDKFADWINNELIRPAN
ncbi:hypothetical protein F8X20_21100 [Salmonella enterica]|nr:hypothetical protein [Salmonella enterica]